MTLEETASKINSLQHLIGQKVPKWNSIILEIMPAPNNDKFVDFIEIFFQTQNIKQAAEQTGANDFEILLIFRTPKQHGLFIYEWYSFFYSESD
ncbi:hypothetical protein DC498_22515 [Terrimonas sp.]|uniref:hypothetical protein n=1 Tax=Terrimonas sp. TaxID=1914338 RepID=UPI000D506293|nr:hypothetical protein [Terrimonas sp.]PVD49986.1 hypothetical protein DC498_22515 [Terrimonas sp.]HRP37138.1 hypothetical protein [Candidatus Dojkabacteria bacterium]